MIGSFTRFVLPEELRLCTVCYSVSVPYISERSFQQGVAELQETDNDLLVRRGGLRFFALMWH